jgi:hypothetical protein
MTGKQQPCLRIPGDRRVLHIDDGILNIGVAQPVLHERHIGARVEQMHRNRVAERISTLHILRRSPRSIIRIIPSLGKP